MPASNDFFTPKSSYNLDELVECGYGRLFGPGNAKLPVNNMLMLDRITEITADGGQYGRGKLVAELDIRPDLWFFDCHFPGMLCLISGASAIRARSSIMGRAKV